MLQTPQASSRHVQQQLEGRVLLEYLEVDGRLHVLVVDRHSCTVEDVGPVGAVADELEALRFGLRRLSTGGSPRMLAAARSSMHVAAERLDRQLLAAVASSLDGRRLVVVPTGDLHALPWSMLPTLRTTAVSVAPSASVWVAATQQPTTANTAAAAGVTLVAGPGLPGAEAEVRSIGKLYGGHGRVLTGDDAHVEGVLEAMDGAAIAHVAAHGAFRSENALLSTILLHDGALTVYDLERLATAPDLVVLSACESGLSRVQPGNELMGLVAALLRQGTRAMVASVAPMPDDVAHTTMVAFHAGLLAGVAPAEALLTAVNGQPEEDRLRAASFVCFGAG
jgi:CHAT domain-containing protein